MSQAGMNNSGSGGGGGSAITTIDGDVGSITGSTVTIYADNAANAAGSSVKFINSGTISTLQLSDANENTMIGKNSGNATTGSAAGQCMEIICTVANLTWVIKNNSGTITLN